MDSDLWVVISDRVVDSLRVLIVNEKGLIEC